MNHTPVLTFFNNKGGVGKTSLVFHLAWMFAEMGKRIITIDLDPQANLTSAFLDEAELEELWDWTGENTAQQNLWNSASSKSARPYDQATTVYRCVRPLTKTGDIMEPVVCSINDNLHLIPGDMALAGFEDLLSKAWLEALNSEQDNLYRPFRILTAFWQIGQMAAQTHNADLILADVGPNLGALNRCALLSSDHVVIPLAADLFSLQGLHNLGPTLKIWRDGWKTRLQNWRGSEFQLPPGTMQPQGYVLMQHMDRLSRPVMAYKKWADRIPEEYKESVHQQGAELVNMADNCLKEIKHYRSLVHMAQEVRKPVFHLTSADGAIGAHARAVRSVRDDFHDLAQKIAQRIHLN